MELFKLQGQLDGLRKLMKVSSRDEELVEMIKAEIKKTNNKIDMISKELNY